MTRLAFHLDAAACTGCKACQVACKDKHDLPVGVLWRRVYEVAGGGWERRGGAWVQDVTAYTLSVACNHCDRPICLEVCPAGAITRRDDGVVLIDGDRCMGCRYCEWACPYGAPQYNAGAGRMTKCTFCVDELERGKPPACVAACPMRVLEFGDRAELEARHGALPEVVPLPDRGLTEPSLTLTPGPSWAGEEPGPGLSLANEEEVSPGRHSGSPTGLSERSLVAFTLLAQTAVGLVWAALLAWLVAGSSRGVASAAVGSTAGASTVLAPLLPVGPLMALAMAASLLHLGAPRNAWRAVSSLGSSWLSREVALAGVFGLGWPGLVALAALVPTGGLGGGAVAVATTLYGLIGAGLVYAMARVYRLRTVPRWDRAGTTVDFFLTAVTLGGLLGALVLAMDLGPTGAGGAPVRVLAALGVAGLAGRALATGVGSRWTATVHGVAGLAGTGAALMATSTPVALPALVLACVAAAVGAVLDRQRFYAAYARVGV